MGGAYRVLFTLWAPAGEKKKKERASGVGNLIESQWKNAELSRLFGLFIERCSFSRGGGQHVEHVWQVSHSRDRK